MTSRKVQNDENGRIDYCPHPTPEQHAPDCTQLAGLLSSRGVVRLVVLLFPVFLGWRGRPVVHHGGVLGSGGGNGGGRGRGAGLRGGGSGTGSSSSGSTSPVSGSGTPSSSSGAGVSGIKRTAPHFLHNIFLPASATPALYTLWQTGHRNRSFGDTGAEGSGAGVTSGSMTGTVIAVAHFGQANVVPPRSSPSVSRTEHPGQSTMGMGRVRWFCSPPILLA